MTRQGEKTLNKVTIMTKSKLRILLALLMSMVASVASAHDFEVDGIYYVITSSTDRTWLSHLEGILMVHIRMNIQAMSPYPNPSPTIVGLTA